MNGVEIHYLQLERRALNLKYIRVSIRDKTMEWRGG